MHRAVERGGEDVGLSLPWIEVFGYGGGAVGPGGGTFGTDFRGEGSKIESELRSVLCASRGEQAGGIIPLPNKL